MHYLRNIYLPKKASDSFVAATKLTECSNYNQKPVWSHKSAALLAFHLSLLGGSRIRPHHEETWALPSGQTTTQEGQGMVTVNPDPKSMSVQGTLGPQG